MPRTKKTIDYDAEFPKRLRMCLDELEKKGGNAADLARAVGIKPQSVSGWKRGENAPDFENLIKIADYFSEKLGTDVSTDWLLGRVEINNRSSVPEIKAIASYTGLSSEAIVELYNWHHHGTKANGDRLLPKVTSSIIVNGKNLLKDIDSYEAQVKYANEWRFRLQMGKESDFEEVPGKREDLLSSDPRYIAAAEISSQMFLNTAMMSLINDISSFVLQNIASSSEEEKEKDKEIAFLTAFWRMTSLG